MIKKYLADIGLITLFFLVVGVFFFPVILRGLLPVPTDSLVGLYHPWRDLYAKTNPQGVPFKNFLTTDPVRQQIPWRKLAVDQLKQGKLPKWNPYTFSGTPLLANIQAAVFYPLNILFFIFAFPVAWTTLIVLEPLLSGIFLYLYLRHLRLNPWASLMGAIAWSFSGFNISWMTWGTMVHVALWLPIILLAVDKLFEKREKQPQRFLWPWLGIFVLALVFQFFAGHIQISFYVMLLTIFYLSWRLWQNLGRDKQATTIFKRFYWLIAGLLFVLLVTSVQWIPLMKLMAESSRIEEINWLKNGWFLPLPNLVQFIMPDFFGNPTTLNYWGEWNYGEFIGYVGIIPLIFSFFGLLEKENKEKSFWGWLLLVSFIFILANPISRLIFIFRVPVISALQPTRLMVIIDFSLAVLAAIGFNSLIKDTRKNIWGIIGIIFLAFLAAWVVVLVRTKLPINDMLRQNLLVSKRNLILPTIIFVFASILIGSSYLWKLNKLFKAAVILILILITVFDLLRFGRKYIPFTPQNYFFPNTSTITFLKKQNGAFRIASMDKRIFPPNTLSYYGLESVEGYDPLYSRRYEEFVAALERGTADIKPPFGFNRIITLENIDSPLLPFLNVRYILSLSEIQRPFLKLVFREGQTYTYEYLLGYPRFYLVEESIVETDDRKTLAMLFNKQYDWRKTAVVNEPLSLINIPLSTNESVNLTAYEDSSIRLLTQTNLPRLLVIINSFDPGWRAQIDGRVTKVYRTNFAFQGVIIPAGRHAISLDYKLDFFSE